MTNELVIAACGLMVGTVLGLTGAGGAMVSVPVLTHFLGYTQAQAMGAAFLIISAGAVTANLLRGKGTKPDFRIALTYLLVGSVITAIVASLAPGLDRKWRHFGFIGIILLAAFSVYWQSRLKTKRPATLDHDSYAPPLSPWLVLARRIFIALIIGCLSGLFGIGGGFLLVPALLWETELSFDRAVATSLIVVMINSLFGLLGAWGFLQAEGIAWTPIVSVAVITMLITPLAARIRAKLSEAKLRLGFQVLLLAIALFEISSYALS